MKATFFAAMALAVTASAVQAQELVIKGSDTLGAKLVPQWAETFKAENEGVTFSIAAEGSSTGFAALLDRTAEIGMSSRRAKSTEISLGASKGVQLKETVVAYDGIGIVVNASNPLPGLTKRQVEQIFAGDITDWAAVGGQPGKISVYTRNTSSGTYADFKELAMRKRDYAASAQKMAGNEQIASEVSRNPAGIGYVGLAYLGVSGIKVLPVDGETPSAEAIREKRYPFSRPVYYYTDGEPKGVAKAFVEFSLSSQAQKVAGEIGFVPVE